MYLVNVTAALVFVAGSLPTVQIVAFWRSDDGDVCHTMFNPSAN